MVLNRTLKAMDLMLRESLASDDADVVTMPPKK
jgi:hypothetical protein